MSAAEMSSEVATRSHPRGGLYVFVPCSQFPKGDGGRGGDERIQRHERERVLEPPCVDTGGGPPLPVRVERSLEGLRQIRIFDDQADLAVLRRRTERPVHARDEDREAVHHGALVVETFDGPSRLEQTDFEGKALVCCATVDPFEHVVIRPRVGFNRGPAAVEENPHRDPATGGRERGFEKWIRRVAPHFVEIERIDRKSHLRGGEEGEDSLGSSEVSGARTIRAARGADATGATHGTRTGGKGNRCISGSCAGIESRRRGLKSASKMSRRMCARSGSSAIRDHPRTPSRSGAKPAFPKVSEPIHATRASTIAYFAWRYRYRFTMSGPPPSHRTSTPAANRPPTTRCSSSSTPPTGEPSRRTRTCTSRSAAAARTDAIRSLWNVYTPTSIVARAGPSRLRRGRSPASGERTAVVAPWSSIGRGSKAD